MAMISSERPLARAMGAGTIGPKLDEAGVLRENPMADWIDGLNDDPRPRLLDAANPAVRHLALRQLCDWRADDPDVRSARVAAMAAPAIDWLPAQQDDRGRWANRYAYGRKMVVDIDVQGQPSRWVTLRACRVLRAVAEARRGAVAAAPA